MSSQLLWSIKYPTMSPMKMEGNTIDMSLVSSGLLIKFLSVIKKRLHHQFRYSGVTFKSFLFNSFVLFFREFDDKSLLFHMYKCTLSAYFIARKKEFLYKYIQHVEPHLRGIING